MRVAALLKLYLVFENSFFDEFHYDVDPIKKYLKPYYLTTKNNSSLQYYMLLSRNEVTLSDYLLYGES